MYYLFRLRDAAHLSNIIFLSVLNSVTPSAALFGTVIVSLTCIYASLSSHKLDFSIEVLNLI